MFLLAHIVSYSTKAGLVWANASLAGPYNPPDASEKVQRAWAELTALMSQSNAEIFASKQMTHDRIQTGTYLRFLESYWPRLREWLQRFESVDGNLIHLQPITTH